MKINYEEVYNVVAMLMGIVLFVFEAWVCMAFLKEYTDADEWVLITITTFVILFFAYHWINLTETLRYKIFYDEDNDG